MRGAGDKVRALVGLALRSRSAALGRQACRRAARDGALHALLLASDAGGSTARDCGAGAGVPLLQAGLDKRQLGALAGRDELAALGITDAQLAAGLARYAPPWPPAPPEDPSR
jgi:hypothetical protein